jgi:hypothetical protein
MCAAIAEDYGSLDLLERLSDPWWFQAFGCVLGFDWHSSGLTTVTCGALKEARKVWGADLGIDVAGGKGKASRKAPAEITAAADRLGFDQGTGDALVTASKLSAKVDSAAVQDGFHLYHHTFLLAPSGGWAVIQQGKDERHARRYHWLGARVTDFTCEPHEGVRTEGRRPLEVLNLIAAEAAASRRAQAQLVLFEDPDRLLNELERVTCGPTLFAPDHHPVLRADVNIPRLRKIVRRAHEAQPADFAALLGTEGVGPATVRALALLAELIHGAPPSRSDLSERRWADYSYAHGGKDGHPFPVDRSTYERSIHVLEGAVRRAQVGDLERAHAFRRLASLGGAPLRTQVSLSGPLQRPMTPSPPPSCPKPKAPARRKPRKPRQLGLF